MTNGLTKKYGLFTAICMVIGIVIGSGIFFKAQNVINATAGDALMGVLAWIIGGAVMAVCAVTFGVMATKYEKVGGVVDYAEATCGKTYAYYLGWFMAIIYYPAMTSVLAWVSARYTLVACFGVDTPENFTSGLCMLLAATYLIIIYFINSIAPKLAGKFQVSATVIKLIPICFIAIVGTIIGLTGGTLSDNFSYVLNSAGEAFGSSTVGEGSLFAAVCGTVFAYEGWIVATAINAEIKNAKKNLPIALGIGAVVIIAAYALYYLGVLGLADVGALGENGTTVAFHHFGTVGSTIINVLIVVSCLGTLNGLMLGCTRGFYAIAARDNGIAPETLKVVDPTTHIPSNSASAALLICMLWLAYFAGGQFYGWFGGVEGVDPAIWDGTFAFDSSEITLVTIYPLYFPILIAFMVKAKDVHPFKRFVLPALSIVGGAVLVIACIISHKLDNVWYLIVFAVIMAIGALFHRGSSGTSLFDKLFAKFRKKSESEASDDEVVDVESVEIETL